MKKNRAIRSTWETGREFLFALFCWIAPNFIIMNVLDSFMKGKIDFLIFILAISSLSCFTACITWDFFTLEIPAITGRNLKHYFSRGRLIPYGPGFFFIFPWYTKRNGKGIFSLEPITLKLTEDYPTKDDKLTAKMTFILFANLDRLPVFESVSNVEKEKNQFKTIEDGLMDHASSFLAVSLIKKPAEESRENIESLQSKMKTKFGVEEEIQYFDDQKTMMPIEEKFGIKMGSASLPDLDYSEKYQEMLTNKKIARMIEEEADNLFIANGGTVNKDRNDGQIIRRKGDISWNEAYNQALVLFGKATATTVRGGGKGVMVDANSN